MLETREPPIINPTEQKQEFSTTFPEILANSPLENTSFVLSIPIMGEWKNGNALRLLRALFAQRTAPGQALEIELIANIGKKLDNLLVSDEKTRKYKTDESGRYLLSSSSNENETVVQKNTKELLLEMDALRSFLEKIILTQKSARLLLQRPDDHDAKMQMEELLTSVSEPLQKRVLQLAIKKCSTISLAVIDATRLAFTETEYQYGNLASLRTLGADIASVRFEDTKDTVVLGLFDADTVPENHTAISDLQQLFNSHPKLTYVFNGMTNFPAGHTTDFVGDGPRETVRRTWLYNSKLAHGSPQISFKLSAYEKLQEIAGWTRLGFQGDEDRDTSIRLMYHFGALQEGLLLEASATNNFVSPTVMTADRLDGSVDSVGRKSNFAENGTRYLTTDMGNVFKFRTEVQQEIDALPPQQKQEALDFLQKARSEFEKKQKVQQRFNRMVLSTFVDMVKKNVVKVTNGELIVDTDELLHSMGGEALLHYLEANPDVATAVLTSKNDVEVIEYFLGKRELLPENLQSLTPFQSAIREYIGMAIPIESLDDTSIITVSQDTSDFVPKWIVEDRRDPNSRSSLMHTVIAETLALGHTHRVLFETKEFLTSIAKADTIHWQWPQNPDEQDLDMHYGEQEKRLKKIKSVIRPTQKKWYQKIDLKSFPMFGLFKSLRVW